MKASQLIVNPQLGLNPLYDLNVMIASESLVITPTESDPTLISQAVADGDPDGIATITITRIADSVVVFSLVSNDFNSAQALINSFKNFYNG